MKGYLGFVECNTFSSVKLLSCSGEETKDHSFQDFLEFILSLLPVLSCLYRHLLSEGVGNYSPLQQVLQGSHMTWAR